jgi:hypothetical protein
VADLAAGPNGFLVSGRTGLTIRALGKVVIEGTSARPSLTVTGSSNVVLQGLRFSHAGAVGSGSIGLDVASSDTVSVVKCAFTGGDAGIRVASTPNFLVDGSKFDRVVDGVRPADGTTAEIGFKLVRVKMKNVTGTGVTANSQYSIVEFCKFAMAPGAAGAVRVLPSPSPINGVIVKFNKIKGGRDGVQVFGNDHETNDNVISKTERHGVHVESGTGAFVARNKIKGCRGAGVFVGTSGNFIEANKIKKSGAFDIQSTVPQGANTYTRNKFKTSQYGM